MRNIMILDGISTVLGGITAATVDTTGVRKVTVIGDGAKILDATSVAADLTGIKLVSFVTKLSSGNLRTSVPIPRTAIKGYNVQMYSAPQNKVVRLGSGLDDANKLVIANDTVGDVSFLIKNLSYNHTISTQRVTVSLTKSASETAEAFVDRIVVQLNAANAKQGQSFFTAAKLGSALNLGISFTTANEHVDLFVGVSGLFESNPIVTTQEAKVSMGAGADVVRMEKDLSKHLGNQGYIENADLYYAQTLEAKASENYNIITVDWEGISPTPTNSIKVANNSHAFAVPVGTSLAPFITMFASIIGQTFTALGGAVDGLEDDANAIDGVNAEKA